MESSHALKTNAAAYLLFVAILAGTTGWVMRGYADEMVIAQSISCGSPATLMVTIPGGFGNAYVGVSYSNRLQVVGGTNCVLPSTPTWTFAGLPAGLTGSSTTGSVTGTPTTAGISPATVVVSDCGIGAQKQTTPSIPIPYTTFALKSASAISITTGVTTVAIPNTSAGQIAQVTFSDGTMFSNPAIPIVWQLAGTAGTINSSTGAITAQQPGGNVSVTANFGGQSSPPESVSITGGTPPSTPTIVTTSPLPNGFATIAYSATLVATGGTGGCCTWSPTGAIGASGLTLGSGGIISGSSPTAGNYNVTVTATDGSSDASQPVVFSIAIGSVNSPVKLSLMNGGGTSISLANNGTAQTQVLCSWSGGGSFSKCPTNLAYSSSSGAATVSATGLITAEAVGTGSANITATVPGCGSCTSNIVSVTVGNSLTITNSALPSGQTSSSGGFAYPEAGSSLSAQLSASGGTPPYTFTCNAGACTSANAILPAGLTMSTAGLISGTLTSAATTQTVVFKVTDSASATATKSLAVTVVTPSALALTFNPTTVTLGGTSQGQLISTFSDSSTQNVTTGSSLAVSQTQGNSASPVTTLTTTVTIPAGHSYDACARQGADNTHALQWSDSANPTNAGWISAGGVITGTSSSVSGHYANCAHFPNTAGVSSVTVTEASGGTATTIDMAVVDSAGMANSSFQDGSAVVNASGSGTSQNCGTLTTTNPTDFVLCFQDTGQAQSSFSMTGLTVPTNGVQGKAGIGYALLSTAQAVTPAVTWSPTSTAYAANIMVAIKAATANGATWGVPGGAGGTMNSSGLYTANGQTGNATESATYGGLTSNTVTLVVQGQVDSSICVNSVCPPSVANVSVSVGQTFILNATGNSTGTSYNSTGNWGDNNTTNLAVNGGGSFTCNVAGSYIATVSFGNLTSGTANISCNATGNASLLPGCTVSASNVSSCAAPAGWTIDCADGFENGSVASCAGGASLQFSTNSTANSHTGTHSMLSSMSGGSGTGESPGGWWQLGSTNTTTDTYLSLWAYVDPNAVAGGETYFGTFGNATQSQVEDTQDYAGQATTSPTIVLFQDAAQGVPSVDCSTAPEDSPLAQNCSFTDGTWKINLGTWQQQEMWYHPSTCSGGVPNNDGFFRFYINGTLVQQVDSAHSAGSNGNGGNLNGCVSMTGQGVTAGGPWTFYYAHPTFNKYVDDVIVMHK